MNGLSKLIAIILLVVTLSTFVQPARAADAGAMAVAAGLRETGHIFDRAAPLFARTDALPLTTLDPLGTEGLHLDTLFRQVLSDELRGNYASFDELAAALRARSGTYDGVQVQVKDVTIQQQGLQVDGQFTLAAQRVVSPALALTVAQAQLNGGHLPTTLSLSTSLAFRLDLAQPKPNLAFALVGLPKLTLSATTDGASNSFTGQLGFLEVQVDGNAKVAATWSLVLNDPDRDGNITLDELNSTAPEDLLTLQVEAGAQINTSLTLTATPLPGSTRPLIDGPPATITLNDADLRDGLNAPTAHLGTLEDFTNLSAVEMLNGLYDLATALRMAQSATDPSLPFLRERLGTSFDFADPVIAFVQQQGEAAITCGRANTDPPTGNLSSLPPGTTTIYCQALTQQEPIAVQWSVANGAPQPNQTVDLRTTAGRNPSANIALNVGGPGTPRVTVTFTDPPSGTMPGTTHQVASLFRTAQELFTNLRDLGGFTLDPADVHYNPSTSSLTYRLRTSFDPPAVQAQLAFGDKLAAETGLTNLQPTNTASATIDPHDVQMDLTFGTILVRDTSAITPGATFHNRFFVQASDGAPELSANANASANVDLTGRLGPLEVQVHGEPGANPIATDNAALLLTRADLGRPLLALDVVPSGQGLAIAGRPTIPRALSLPILLLQAKDVVKSQINLRVSGGLVATSQIGNPSIELGRGNIGLNWADTTQGIPSITPDAAFTQSLKAFDITPGQPRALLYAVIDQLDAQAASMHSPAAVDARKALETKLPLTDVSIYDLLPQPTAVRQLADSLRANTPNSLQELEREIETRLGVSPAAVQFALEDAPATGSSNGDGVLDLVVRLGYHLCTSDNHAIETCANADKLVSQLPTRLLVFLDEQRGLIGKTADASLLLEFDSRLQLDTAVPLSPATTPMALSSSAATVRAGIAADNVNTLATLGALAVQAQGRARLNANFRLAPAASSGATLSPSDFANVLHAEFTVPTQQTCGQVNGQDFDGMACTHLTISQAPTSAVPPPDPTTQPTPNPTQSPPDEMIQPTSGPTTQPSTAPLTTNELGAVYLPLVTNSMSSQAQRATQSARQTVDNERSSETLTSTTGGTTQASSWGEMSFATDRPITFATLNGRTGWTSTMSASLAGRLADAPLSWTQLPNALDSSLTVISDALVQATKLPLVGDKLDAGADLVQKTRDRVVTPLQAIVTGIQDATTVVTITDKLQRELAGQLGDLLVDGPDADTAVSPNDLRVVLICDGEPCAATATADQVDDVRLTFFIGTQQLNGADPSKTLCTPTGNPSLCEEGTSLPIDLGLPGLPLWLDGTLKAKLGWKMLVDFGLKRGDAPGPYLVVGGPGHGTAEPSTSPTENIPELRVGASVQLGSNPSLCSDDLPDITNPIDQPGLQSFSTERCVKGKLGFLGITVRDGDTISDTNAENDPTNLSLLTSLDLPATNGNIVTSSAIELSQLTPDLRLDADANVDLRFRTSIDGEAALPSVLGTFHITWNWSLNNPNPANQNPTDVSFQNLHLDAGTFIGDFLGPITSRIKDITSPLQPVINILRAPLPGLSDLNHLLGGGDITLLNLAGSLGETKLITDFVDFADFASSLPSGSNRLIIPLGNSPGSFVVNTTQARIGYPGHEANQVEKLVGAVTDFRSDTLLDDIRCPGPEGCQFKKFPDALTFPFLENPQQIIGLLLGSEDVKFIKFNPGPLSVRVTTPLNFPPIPVFPPVFLKGSIQLDFGLEGRFAMGYDSKGLVEAFGSGSAVNLVEGLFIDDGLSASGDAPELALSGKITAELAGSVVAFEAGISGGVELSAKLDLHDDDGDGALHFAEIGDKLSNPVCLFDVGGKLDVVIEAFFKVNLLLFKKDWSTDIFRATIIDLEASACGSTTEPPVLATVEDINGDDKNDLVLNMGSVDRRNSRAFQSNEEKEAFTVRQLTTVGAAQTSNQQPGTKFGIAAFGAYEEHIIPEGGIVWADGDTGDDTIALLPGVDQAGTPIPFTVSATLTGGSGNDQLQSGDGNDALNGGDGDDTLNGGKGVDTLNGDAGNDKLNGASGDDTITGGDGNDVISGGAGEDKLDGGEGDDVIQGGSGTSTDPDGKDTIIGGAGSDSLLGDDGDDTIYGDEQLTCDADGAASGSNKDRLLGGPGNDHLYGGAGSDGIYGNAGNDTLCGNAGDDEIYGDQGEQTAPDDGHDVLDGGSDNDLLRGNGGDDDLFGRGGDDTLLGETGNDDLSGGLGTDTLRGDDGRDYLFGDDGSATRLPGQANAASVAVNEVAGDGDFLFGGAGDDVAYGEGGADEVRGEDGRDELHGNDGDDFVYGSLQPDVLFGGNGNDQLFGENGDDHMLGNGGNDLIRGSIGDDYAEGNSGADDIYGDADQDDLIGGSAVAGVDDADVSINQIDPPRGDHLFGNAATDVLAGDNAQITRPSGITTYDGSTVRLVTLFDRDAAVPSVSGADYMEGNEANDLLYGQGGNDTLRGNGGDDYAEGNAGNDTIYGDQDQDDLIGGSSVAGLPDGRDNVYGGDGAANLLGDFDILAGDNAQITRPLDDAGHWQVNSFNAAIQREVTLLDQAISGEPAIPLGVSGNDTLRGEGSDDRMYGQGGDDPMDGGAGNDYMEGNAASDIMYGGPDQDDVIGGSAAARHLDGNDQMWGGDGSTVLTNDFDVLVGDNAAIVRPLTFGAWQRNLFNTSVRRQVTLRDEVLIGDAVDPLVNGSDQIYGEAGDDVIFGAGAGDQLRGGAGDDYVEGNAAADIVYGDHGQDDLIGGSSAPGRIDADDKLWGGDGQTAFDYDHDVIVGDNGAIARPLSCGQWQGTSNNQRIIRNVTIFEIAATKRTVVVRGNDHISGESGDDRIYGQGGDDTVSGGAGDDSIEGNADHDTLDGGEGNDDIVGGTGRINNDGPQGMNGRLDGRDTITGGAGYDVLAGDNAILTRVLVDKQPSPACSPSTTTSTLLFVGGRWMQNSYNGSIRHEPRILLDSNSPNTTVVSGDDRISGEAADDLIYGQGGNDDLQGGDGDDLIEGNAGSDSIASGNGDDDIIGGTSQASVFDDVPDTLRGEAGDDVIAGDNATISRPLNVDGQWQRDAKGRRVRSILLFNVLIRREGVDPRRESWDTIEGGAGRDQLLGQGGNDQIDGGDDGDYLEGNAGADTMRGSGGVDVLIGGSSGADGKVRSGKDLSSLVDTTDLIDGGGNGDKTIQDNGAVGW